MTSEKIFKVIEVESYSGFRPDERPLRFEYDEQLHRVDQVLDAWYQGSVRAGTPNYKFFRIQTDNGHQFLLRLNLRFRTWAVEVRDRHV